METYNDENDAFNWEAAVAAMEHMSLIPNRPKDEQFRNVLKETTNQNRKGTNQEGTLGTSNPQTKVHQKTMLSFVQRYTREPEEALMRPHSEYEDPAVTAVIGIEIDPISAKTWVYPVNVPMRDYQFSIVQTALFTNTLVSLPTGLGKTLIAAVVMYNFFRWFPSGKIVFTAPSRPLVLQQIESCHDSVGIPQDWTIDMTGQMNPTERAGFWKTKRVFFVTPQVLEKDIHSGSCPMQELVCLVVDEAHRATGNYSYCIVVRKLMEASIRLRILALTATPGSKQTTIQAVVDNLRISCLEYRSESDSDVRQYVHSKKIELLQVAMDLESLKIKDLFLEVLQPLVNKLCGFGVFYSRDAARLTPYEFLTARDKFRQAPPSGLDQRQYGDVEACFAAIITLYHIFKLLFSHGIRPAFEMLKQKLLSGPFARLMGRNENLQQIKSLMQKHVGNGASSPKLLKLQELVSEHFKKNDPAKTRVIIFTNFRESVKDILETLQTLGDTIKAMEFIGQSSGKSSKGQSQKVQQSVLQKFRAGGFNTIVATSIAEEGLDIMEVDLVICFDANISPLRMIQRMGRTGRKRDGRVIVLASEGAELQGYLKKQAKSKVLSKHMHNGGVRSFNFHSSPRMVPHSFKPEVQLLELSIVKFVPRVKNKQKPVETFDPGAAALTVEELLILRRYIEPSQPAAWRPSLIAFPHCQLLASRVHKVKHSVKTVSMLVDTLQLLRQNYSHRKHDEQTLNVMEAAIPKDTQGYDANQAAGKVECSQEKNKPLSFISHSSVDAKVKAEGLDSEKGEDLLEEATCSGSPLLSEQHEWTWQAELSCSTHYSLVNPKDGNTSTHALPDELMLGDIVNRPEPVNRKMSVAFNSPSSFNVGQKLVETDFHNTDKCLPESGSYGSLSPFKHQELIGQENERMPGNQCLPVNSKMSTASDHPLPQLCIFEGIVSVDSGGYVQVTSPPTLPFRGQCKHSLCICTDSAVEYNANVKISSLLPSELCEAQDLDNESNICHGMDQLGVAAEDSTSTPIHEVRHIVTSTPEEKMLKVSGIYGEGLEPDENNLDNDSPRLCSLAEQGIVPSSPCLDNSSVQKELEVANTSSLFDGFSLHDEPKWDASRCKHPSSNSRNMYLEAWRAVRSPSKPIPVSQKNKKVLDDDLRRVINLNNSAHAGASVSLHETIHNTPTVLADGKAANVPRVLSLNETIHNDPAVLDDGNEANVPTALSLNETTHTTPTVLADGKPANVTRVMDSPLCPCSRRSTSGNWRLSLEAMSSVDKPRKLKRLRKVQNGATTETVKSSSLVHREQKGKSKKPMQVEAGLGKQRLHSAAAVLVDEEAEVSTDEAVSTDEDDVEDEEGSLEDFIDDRPEPTVASQSGASEPVDMMAVYRKSLLTQSPLHGDFGPWTRFLKPNSTPLSGYTDSLSSHKSKESKLLEFTNSCEKTVVGSGLTVPAGSFLVTPCLGSHSTMPVSFDSDSRQIKENNTSGKNNDSGKFPNDSQSGTKLQCRKRKLSFQQQGVSPNFEMSDVAGNFDDDIFIGVDLDALEVEAAQLSRSQFQANVSQPVVAVDADIHRIRKDQICMHVDIGHDDFECFPSFNLGIDC